MCGLITDALISTILSYNTVVYSDDVSSTGVQASGSKVGDPVIPSRTVHRAVSKVSTAGKGVL
jgi:hypothetical protein